MYRVLPGVLRANRLGASFRLCSLGTASGFPEQIGIVLQTRGHVGVLRPEGLLPDDRHDDASPIHTTYWEFVALDYKILLTRGIIAW